MALHPGLHGRHTLAAKPIERRVAHGDCPLKGGVTTPALAKNAKGAAKPIVVGSTGWSHLGYSRLSPYGSFSQPKMTQLNVETIRRGVNQKHASPRGGANAREELRPNSEACVETEVPYDGRHSG